MPWLHLVFDAWEDYRRMRESESADREALAAAVRDGFSDPNDDDDENGDDDRKKEKKKKKRRKDKK